METGNWKTKLKKRKEVSGEKNTKIVRRKQRNNKQNKEGERDKQNNMKEIMPEWFLNCQVLQRHPSYISKQAIFLTIPCHFIKKVILGLVLGTSTGGNPAMI